MKNKVITQLSLVLRSNQVEISKPNTVSQLAEAVIIDRNSREHCQNEVKLKKRFTKNKECQDKSHLIYCGARPSSKLCIAHNKKPLENILF